MNSNPLSKRLLVVIFTGLLLLASSEVLTVYAREHKLALSIESEQDISTLATPGGPGHGATIAQTTAGAVLAAWWSGPERAPETDIWMSCFDTGTWSAPYRVFDGDEVDKDYTCENCMLFQPKNGPLMLFVLAGGPAYKKPDDTAIYYHNLRGHLKTSTDDGQTWSAPRALGAAPGLVGGNLIGPTKNPPIQLSDGTILVPSSNEYGLLQSRQWEKFTYHFEKSADGGATWSLAHVCPDPPDQNMMPIQPGILRLGGTKLMALGRNQSDKSREVPTVTSSDNGQTWTVPSYMTNLKAHKSGICPLTLSDGTHVCFVNRYPGNSERDELDLMVSTDGTNWSFGINVQGTDGMDAHYPQAVQTADGKLHVVYSYNIHNQQGIIRHAIIRTGIAATSWTPPACPTRLICPLLSVSSETGALRPAAIWRLSEKLRREAPNRSIAPPLSLPTTSGVILRSRLTWATATTGAVMRRAIFSLVMPWVRGS